MIGPGFLFVSGSGFVGMPISQSECGYELGSGYEPDCASHPDPEAGMDSESDFEFGIDYGSGSDSAFDCEFEVDSEVDLQFKFC